MPRISKHPIRQLAVNQKHEWIAIGDVRVGKLLTWSDPNVGVRFFYTTPGGDPMVRDFENEAAFREWLFAA